MVSKDVNLFSIRNNEGGGGFSRVKVWFLLWRERKKTIWRLGWRAKSLHCIIYGVLTHDHTQQRVFCRTFQNLISNLSTGYVVLLSVFVSKLLKSTQLYRSQQTYANNISFYICCASTLNRVHNLNSKMVGGNGSPQLISCRRSKLLIEEIMGVLCY